MEKSAKFIFVTPLVLSFDSSLPLGIHLSTMSLLLSGAHRVMLSSVQKSRFIHERTVFFNRKREIELCLDHLKGKPAVISVFTGPPDSGKTALLKHVLDQQEDRPVVSIDMRAHAFNNAEAFLMSMESTLAPWYSSIKKYGDKLVSSTTMTFPFAELDLSKLYTPDLELTPMLKVEKIFNFIIANTPDFSFWTGQFKSPIFFIDEANKMDSLTKTDIGKEALLSLLNFFVKCTKQDHRFHVVLASSDSFYHLWLSKYIGTNRFKTFVVGNLSKEEALKFWKEHALTKCHIDPLPSFEEAFTVCGGNILLLERYVAEYCEKKGSLLPERFSCVVIEKTRLVMALLETTDRWSRANLLDVMSQLNEAENGFIMYEKLCNKITKDVVDSMIKANLIHMRPSTDYTYDLEGAPDEAILTAESPASAAAMKLIVTAEK